MTTQPAPPSRPRHFRPLALCAVVAVVTASLAGCSDGPKNTDPRKGRVVMRDTNCLYGSCEYDWKACAGPDLIVKYTGAKVRTVRNSPECAS